MVYVLPSLRNVTSEDFSFLGYDAVLIRTYIPTYYVSIPEYWIHRRCIENVKSRKVGNNSLSLQATSSPASSSSSSVPSSTVLTHTFNCLFLNPRKLSLGVQNFFVQIFYILWLFYSCLQCHYVRFMSISQFFWKHSVSQLAFQSAVIAKSITNYNIQSFAFCPLSAFIILVWFSK